MDQSQKSSKRMCIMCYRSPQNILVLACDHTVCLQCAYVTMTHRTSSLCSDIEFGCAKCQEITYFDKDLIKQIEASIQSGSKQKGFEKERSLKGVTQQKMQIANQGESFIEKMRNQYFSEKPLIPPGYQQGKVKNINQNLETKPKNFTPSQKQFFSNKFSQSNPILSSYQHSPKVYKADLINSNPTKSPKKANTQQTKCRFHPYYELIYFCMECRQVVCPQCLLRGEHKEHKNQSIAQILEQELPDFINQASEKIYKQLSQIEAKKQQQFHEMNQKFNEIKSIRHNAQLYFMQVRKNLERQERQVLEKCDQLLNNLKKEELQNQMKQKNLEQSLSLNIQEIKSLKSFYEEFSTYEQCDTSRKGIEKSLIHKYLNCLKSVNGFLDKEKNQKHPSYEQKFSCTSRNQEESLANESEMLNKRIEDGIKSLRESLVFDNFAKPANLGSKYDKKQYPSRMTTKLEPYQEVPKNTPKPNEYISYISTQNSQSKSKQIIVKKSREKSVSISPYKGEIPRQSIQIKKSAMPYKKPMFRETAQFGKENILIQQGSRDMKTQVSTQNASGIKAHSRKEQKPRLNSKQKSKNSSITKNKKRNSLSYTNSVVNRFKV